MPADASIGRLDTDDPAGTGRVAQAPSGVGAEGAETETRGRRHARPAGRLPGPMIGIPGIARRDDRGVITDAGEFGHYQLSDQHRARRAQPADDGGVLGGNAIPKDFRTAGGSYALGIDQVLGRVGNAVQRTPVVSLGNLIFGEACLTQREIRAHGNERMQLLLERLDAFQGGLGEFDGRDFPPLDQRGGPGDGITVQQRGGPFAPVSCRSRASSPSRPHRGS